MFQETSQDDSLSEIGVPPLEELTVQERQLWLNDAFEKYLEGEISKDTFRKVEEKLEVDYAKAALEQTSVRSEVSSALRKWINKFFGSPSQDQAPHDKKDISTTESRSARDRTLVWIPESSKVF